MYPTLQRYLNVANDYDPQGASQGGPMTDLETLRTMLARAHVPTFETVGVFRFHELRLEVGDADDTPATVIFLFDEEGALLTVEVEGRAEA
jgi:hypothetical protein